MTTSLVAITGNTFPVKDYLKALGARWNPETKAWMVAADKAATARKIVAGAGSGAAKTSGKPHFSKCHDCGRPSRGFYRCWDCKQDNDDSPIAHTFTRADGSKGVWMEY
jgi:hypothetical protein